jgi:ABC-2 type transport system ATP-binding protein
MTGAMTGAMTGDSPRSPTATEDVVVVEGLVKRFGSFEAVGGTSFCVRRGEIFGLLGANGAGKTTTIEILEGYQDRSAGQVTVLGVDPARATRRWRERIGLVLQESELSPLHTVAEIVGLFASLYPSPRSVDETVELVGLTEKRNERVGRLSGGQKRRVDVALGIVGRPELLFLDEPTTGFDPAARREFWTMLEGLRATGTTMILTTHYMDEAQHLADRSAIMRRGRIVAEGTLEDLSVGLGGTLVRFRPPPGTDAAAVAAAMGRPAVADGPMVQLSAGDDVQGLLLRLLTWAEGEGLALAELEALRPTLDDVFMEVNQEGEAP